MLEPFLAHMRARKADRLIPPHLRNGRILDIGCGTFPYFLSHTAFQEKFAIDQVTPSEQPSGIAWHALDLNKAPQLPFADGYFSAITMLAVVEHLDPQSLVTLFREAHRALRPDGMLIVTTPAAWSDGLLHVMANLRLVSKEEIKEHQYAYTLPLLGWYFGMANFEMNRMRFGFFECGLNMWATAKR